MMGKILVLGLITSFLGFQTLKAQNGYTRGMRAGYGFLSDVQIITAFADTYSNISSGISGTRSDYSTTGPFIIGFKFYLSEKVAIGPEINLVKVQRIERSSTGEVVRDQFLFVNLSGRFDFRYVNRENLQMYSGVSLGPAYIFGQSDNPSTEDKSGFFISYQLNFFGVRFGKEWGGYAELGFGRNGLLNVGISRQF